MKKVLLTVACLIMTVSCQMLPLKNNDYYTRTQVRMIEKTTDAVQVGFGFDSRLDINYFFFKRQLGEDELSQNFGGLTETPSPEAAAFMSAYTEAMSGYSDAEQYEFYLKIYRLYSMIDYLHGYYERYKMWREYNYIRLELYPATRYYMDATEAYFKNNKPDLYGRIRSNKSEVRKNAIMFVQKKYTIVDEY